MYVVVIKSCFVTVVAVSVEARGDGVWISLASEERLDILRRGVRFGFLNWV